MKLSAFVIALMCLLISSLNCFGQGLPVSDPIRPSVTFNYDGEFSHANLLKFQASDYIYNSAGMCIPLNGNDVVVNLTKFNFDINHVNWQYSGSPYTSNIAEAVFRHHFQSGVYLGVGGKYKDLVYLDGYEINRSRYAHVEVGRDQTSVAGRFNVKAYYDENLDNLNYYSSVNLNTQFFETSQYLDTYEHLAGLDVEYLFSPGSSNKVFSNKYPLIFAPVNSSYFSLKSEFNTSERKAYSDSGNDKTSILHAKLNHFYKLSNQLELDGAGEIALYSTKDDHSSYSSDILMLEAGVMGAIYQTKNFSMLGKASLQLQNSSSSSGGDDKSDNTDTYTFVIPALVMSYQLHQRLSLYGIFTRPYYLKTDHMAVAFSRRNWEGSLAMSVRL